MKGVNNTSILHKNQSMLENCSRLVMKTVSSNAMKIYLIMNGKKSLILIINVIIPVRKHSLSDLLKKLSNLRKIIRILVNQRKIMTSLRNYSFKYHLFLGNEKIRVCKKFYLATLTMQRCELSTSKSKFFFFK